MRRAKTNSAMNSFFSWYSVKSTSLPDAFFQLEDLDRRYHVNVRDVYAKYANTWPLTSDPLPR
eukprot:768603-Hanusia_phi.AAC.7